MNLRREKTPLLHACKGCSSSPTVYYAALLIVWVACCISPSTILLFVSFRKDSFLAASLPFLGDQLAKIVWPLLSPVVDRCGLVAALAARPRQATSTRDVATAQFPDYQAIEHYGDVSRKQTLKKSKAPGTVIKAFMKLISVVTPVPAAVLKANNPALVLPLFSVLFLQLGWEAWYLLRTSLPLAKHIQRVKTLRDDAIGSSDIGNLGDEYTAELQKQGWRLSFRHSVPFLVYIPIPLLVGCSSPWMLFVLTRLASVDYQFDELASALPGTLEIWELVREGRGVWGTLKTACEEISAVPSTSWSLWRIRESGQMIEETDMG